MRNFSGRPFWVWSGCTKNLRGVATEDRFAEEFDQSIYNRCNMSNIATIITPLVAGTCIYIIGVCVLKIVHSTADALIFHDRARGNA